MGRKGYLRVSAAIFSVLSLAHLTRLFSGWEIAVAGITVPRWLSLPGLAVTVILASWGFVPARKEGS